MKISSPNSPLEYSTQPRGRIAVCSIPGRLKTETAMIRQEAESSPSVVSNGSTLIADPLLVEPLAGTNPERRVPHVSCLTYLSIAGRKAGLLTVTTRLTRSSRNLLTALGFSGTAGATHDCCSLTGQNHFITLANHLTLRQPELLAAVARSSTGWFYRSCTGRCTAFDDVVTADSWSSTSWLAACSAGRTAVVAAAVQLWQVQLWQAELRHVQLRQLNLWQLEAALLFAAAAASTAIATSVTADRWCCTGWLNRSCTGWCTAIVSTSSRSCTGWCTAVVATSSRSCTCWVNRSCTGWSTTVVATSSRSCTGCFNAAATSIVMLEQTEQTGLCAVGDREYHQSSCKCNCLHLKFS